MTRATNGVLSVLCLSTGALLVAYALTADVAASSPETVTLTVRGSQAAADRPMEIRYPATARAEFDHAVRLAFEPRRARR